MIAYLDLSELLTIAAIVNRGDPGVRDYGRLASAAERPKTTVFGVDAYTTLFDKAAALLHSITCDHPLVDGNKRTAFQAASLMLEINGIVLPALPDEQEILMYDVTEGRADVPEIAAALARWCDPDRGSRPIRRGHQTSRNAWREHDVEPVD